MHAITEISELRERLGSPHPLTESKIYSELNQAAMDFVRQTSLIFLATADTQGRPTVSPKGDAPGFVQIVNERTLLIPERPGNKLLHGLSNILENGQIGLIFVMPGTEETLRVNGRCTLFHDDDACAAMTANGKPALLLLKVSVEQCFFHCGKAFKRSHSWEPEKWPARQKISFGKQIANQKTGDNLAGKVLAAAVDRAVKSDYKKNL